MLTHTQFYQPPGTDDVARRLANARRIQGVAHQQCTATHRGVEPWIPDTGITGITVGITVGGPAQGGQGEVVVNHHWKIMEKNIWQCVKTNSTPSVHIKIAGIYGCSFP